jgi:hypothetical protein
MDLATGQLPHQPRINSSEPQFPILGLLPGTLNVIQNPLYLCSAEICVYNQARFLPYPVLKPVATKAVAQLRSAPVLPHNGIIHRFTSFSIPHNSGFALVCYSDSRYILTIDIYFRNSLGYNRSLRRPYMVWVVLNPS